MIKSCGFCKKNRGNINVFSRSIKNGTVIEKVNLIRATLSEAFEMKDNLTEDMTDYNRIIVDLTSCDYVDGTFLGVLVYSYKKIKKNDGIIVLVIGDTFLSTSFIFKEIKSIFRVYRTINEALGAINNTNEEINIDHAKCENDKKVPDKIVQLQLPHIPKYE